MSLTISLQSRRSDRDAPVRSALALELGATCARALLIELVDGHSRVVAVGESLAVGLGPLADAATGARSAIAQIETAVGRALFGQGGVLRPRGGDGSGVDTVTLVVDAPLTVRLLSCGERVAATAARRVLTSMGVAEVPTLELRADEDPAALARELTGRPSPLNPGAIIDAILLVGPADARMLARLAEALALLSPTGAAHAPIVFWAGEAAGTDAVRQALAGCCQLRIAAPIVPRADLEHPAPTREALSDLWRERIERSTPGAESVARWADGRVTPRRLAEEIALGCLAAQHGTVWLARAEPDAATVLCTSAAAPRDVAAARHEGDARLGGLVRPWTLGAARERSDVADALRAAVASLPAARRPSAGRGAALVIAAGDLAFAGAEDAFRAMVDGLQPVGALQVVVDELDGLAAIGGLATAAPVLAAGVLNGDLLRPLGALVAPGWRARGGRVAFRFRAESGEAATRHEPVDVGAEESRRIRLGEGESAIVHVERPAWWDPRRLFGARVGARLAGGPVGLVLDGRARPIAAPLALGRDAVHDDAAAARRLGDLVAARPVVSEPALLRRARFVPPDARLLVGPGDSVEAGELIASAHGADGGGHVVIPAGRLLGTADPRPHLVVTPGSEVAVGQVIARRESFFGLVTREVRAPSAGLLSTELAGPGNLAIVTANGQLGIAAPLPGTIVAMLPDLGVVVETTGAVVSATVGFGPEARGPLLPPSARFDSRAGRPRGAVAVLDVLDRAQFEALHAAGAAGAVVGSILTDLAVELDATPPNLAIVAVEGIGSAPLCAPARVLLAAHAGAQVSLTPGDRRDPRVRPEVIVPLPVSGVARLAPDPRLAAGSTVRVVDVGTAIGRVISIAREPSRLESGVWTRLAEVEIEAGERVNAPLANLELVS